VPRRGTAGLVILTAALAAAAGVLAAVGLRATSPPDDLAAAAEVTSAPVTGQDFVDERTLAVRLAVGADRQLSAHRDGTVTQTACSPGVPIASGTVPLQVDAVPVIALHTAVPPYRDLRLGDRGADVTALQQELTRLGHAITVDGRYGAATRKAFRALEQGAGQPAPDGLAALADLAWLPAPTFTPDACPLSLGDPLGSGAAFATAAGMLTAVAVPDLPAHLVAGERTLELFGTTTALPAEGAPVTDAAFLDEVAASDEYAAWLASADQQPPHARIALVHPIRAFTVPPAAIFALEGSSGCVQVGATPRAVTIVGSGLGASLVVFDTGSAPDLVNLGAAVTAASCPDASDASDGSGASGGSGASDGSGASGAEVRQ
jgi:peptidoglycan hydrolase-like protein with peptidoglycan-binding domain